MIFITCMMTISFFLLYSSVLLETTEAAQRNDSPDDIQVVELEVLSTSGSVVRPSRSLQQCPDVVTMIGEIARQGNISASISKEIASWFNEIGDSGFIEKLIEEIINVALEQKSGVYSGLELQNKEEEYPLCKILPLQENDCFLTAYPDPDYTFFEKLIANNVPFAKDIIKARETFDEEVNKIIKPLSDAGEEIEEKRKDVVAAVEQFYGLNPNGPVGSCAVLNKDMFGIYESPGAPAPSWYDFCNCISMQLYGIWKCPVQFFIRGLAAGGSGKLSYDPEITPKIFDGNIEYKISKVEGDAWIGFALKFVIPKLPKDDLVCIPPGDLLAENPVIDQATKANTPTNDFIIEFVGSLFIKNDLNKNDGKLLALAAIGDSAKTKIFKKDVFLAELDTPISAMLRVRSEDPDCFPSGLFFNANIDTSKMEIKFAKKVSKFLFTTPQIDGGEVGGKTISVSAGVTWKDRGNVGGDDVIQSFFLRVQKEVQFLGIKLVGEIEFQYFDDKEFDRRNNFNVDECCNNIEVVKCDFPERGLMEAMNQDYIQFEAQPTFGIFARIGDLDFYGIVIIYDISLVVIIQIPENDKDFKLLVRFAADVKVLILEARTEVVFALTESGALAKFEGEVIVDTGPAFGKASLKVKAKAEIGDMLYNERDIEQDGTVIEDRQLAALDSLSDADWDISCGLDYKPAEWMVDVGKKIIQGLRVAIKEIEEVWNAVTGFVAESMEKVFAWAKGLGEKISKVFDYVADFINKIGENFDKAVDAIAKAMKNDFGPLGEIVGEIVEGGGQVVKILIEGFETAAEFGSKLFSGDIEGAFKELGKFAEYVGEVSYDLISSENFKRWEYKEGELGCQLYRKVYDKCVFGLSFTCTKHYGSWTHNITCLNINAGILQKLNTTAVDADAKKECRNTSQERNKGLKAANSLEDEELSSALNLDLSFDFVDIGKTSALEGKQNEGLDKELACKQVKYNLHVGKFVPNVEGLAERTTSAKTSLSCLNFASEDSLKQALGQFRVEEEDRATESAKSAALGGLGLDTDDELQSCEDSINGLDNCVAIKYEEKDDFALSTDITCRDYVPNLKQYFGSVNIIQDTRCTTEPIEGFQITGGSQDSECETRQIFIKRIIEGCCGEPVEIQHTLNIAPLPPKITQPEKSLDVVTACDANIHISAFDLPTYTSGCKYSDTSLSFKDGDPNFNKESCTTSITRIFNLNENGCVELDQTFTQEITLTNDYLPEFESFPPDVTIDVFDEYGTDALGFPTAFQRCGLPVTITYSDVISEGQCFAERIIQRTFKIIDECGHQNERTQTITIANDKSRLPYSFKSLANLYAHYKLDAKYLLSYPSKKTKSCSIDSARCNITGSLNQECKSGDFESEFQPYESMLLTLLEKRMSPGPSKRSCVCTAGDADCDVRMNIDANADDVVQYGTQVTSAPGRCVVDESIDLSHEGVEDIYKVKCPVKATKSPKSRRDLSSSKSSSSKSSKSSSEKSNKTSKSSKGSNACFEKALLGTNEVYNFFNISVLDLSNATIYIDTPSTSITYVHVHVPVDVYKKVYFGKRTMGVRLAEGMTSHNILWHIPAEVDLKMDSDLPVGWSFYGTLLNHFGKVKLKASEYNPVSWQGQIFADEIKVYDDLEIECGGHFAGFIPCENVME